MSKEESYFDSDEFKTGMIVMELSLKIDKLKRLLLLTDDSVSNYQMSELQIKQWNEYIRCFPEENKK